LVWKLLKNVPVRVASSHLLQEINKDLQRQKQKLKIISKVVVIDNVLKFYLLTFHSMLCRYMSIQV